MKPKSFAAALCVALFVVLAGCASNAPKPLTPAQIVSIACPPVQAAIVQFKALDATMPADPVAVKAEAALTKVQPVVAAACAAGANVDATSLQAFAQTVLPALGQVAGALPLPPQQLAQIQAGLIAAEIAVGAVGVVEQQIKAAQATPASASSAH